MRSSELLKKMLEGDRPALARMISLIENRSADLLPLMAEVHKRSGQAHVVGVTGPPGSGKSTLVDQLIAAFRKEEKKVGVIAIDPSSPFSGGAILGDRIRMQSHAGDDGVFIRSLGSRGSHGGLSKATREVVRLLDAAGMDVVLVETVGVGQTELDIMEIAQTTIVLLTPESGDAIQTMKAGILEIANIFVVNKSDRPGGERLRQELLAMMEMGAQKDSWKVPVLLTQAVKGAGLPELVQSLERHRSHWIKTNDQKWQQKRAEEELREIVVDELVKKADFSIKKGANPYQRAQEILAKLSRIF
ncbi:MAG: methylmalonyl Co-A mutase-associated GTPase MeaB [Deltaproteobacteria bacterium]|nr:methylmalonyl Co-A mutase-associated GTPase MeaB [Deltaproteobacteria bacterium]